MMLKFIKTHYIIVDPIHWYKNIIFNIWEKSWRRVRSGGRGEPISIVATYTFLKTLNPVDLR
jgi:hypothetical protein